MRCAGGAHTRLPGVARNVPVGIVLVDVAVAIIIKTVAALNTPRATAGIARGAITGRKRATPARDESVAIQIDAGLVWLRIRRVGIRIAVGIDPTTHVFA